MQSMTEFHAYDIQVTVHPRIKNVKDFKLVDIITHYVYVRETKSHERFLFTLKYRIYILLWIPSHGQTSMRRPARTYIHNISVLTQDVVWKTYRKRWTIETNGKRERERERERVREIRATGSDGR